MVIPFYVRLLREGFPGSVILPILLPSSSPAVVRLDPHSPLYKTTPQGKEPAHYSRPFCSWRCCLTSSGLFQVILQRRGAVTVISLLVRLCPNRISLLRFSAHGPCTVAMVSLTRNSHSTLDFELFELQLPRLPHPCLRLQTSHTDGDTV